MCRSLSRVSVRDDEGRFELQSNPNPNAAAAEDGDENVDVL